MKLLFVAAVTTILSLQTLAQSAGKARELKKTITLKMARTADDEMPGTRGASVVWHPVQKKYYAAMAGNVGYPLSVFDASGKRISNDEHSTGEDVRGLWYNPLTKTIEGNAYGSFGWFTYKLGKNGMVEEVKTLFEGLNQPSEQCVGAYNAAKKQVLFLYGSMVYTYRRDSAIESNNVIIHWGRTKADGVSEDEDETAEPENHNRTTIVYTGMPGAELGFLNFMDMQIELYNIKDGFLTRTLKLPADAIAEATFNFSYTNGTFWLFDMTNREWTGYK